MSYKNHIAIILIHHLRKQKDDDPLNMLSGTTGVVDNIYVLEKNKRTSNKATLLATGRDIKDIEMKLYFDSEKFVWIQEEKLDALEKMGLDGDIEIVDNLFSILTVKEFSGTATELSNLIAEKTGISITASVLAKKLVKYNEDFCSMGYEYETHRTPKSRIITIRKKK